jgi:hypothetical protein
VRGLIRSQPLVRFCILFTNTTESALSARENDIAMAIIELNKKNHILEDRLLALELLVRRIKEQAIGIQYTRNVFNGLLSEIRQQRDKKWRSAFPKAQ